jgi:secondary thiamine-phosphate synthase enzyme
VRQLVTQSGVQDGIALIHCTGTTASIIITEYEAGILEDLRAKFEEFVPRKRDYRHHDRGVDNNGSAHVLYAFLNQNTSIPITGGKLLLGTWQEIVLINLDTVPRLRTWVLQIIGN